MRPSRQVVPSGQTLVFIGDYLSMGNLGIMIIPTGGASVAVNITADDVNDPIVAPTWITAPTPFNAAITTNVYGSISLFPIRALQFIVTVGGQAAITVLLASGNDGVPAASDA